MADSSFNSSSNNSSSSSVPGIFPTPQSDFSLQLSKFLEQLGASQAQWGDQQFAKVGAVTDAQIQNYLQMANQGAGLAGQTLGRYENTFAPLEDQYAREAQTYDSAGRIQHDMGRAEAGAKQAADAAKANSENELQSFGVDPSSGRYQDLILASNTKSAADAAAAGEQARATTEAQGQQRKVNAIMMGQQLPGAAVNALNSAYQGIAGAENSVLGAANTGVNLKQAGNPALIGAKNPEQPLFGNTSQSKGSGGSAGGSVGGGGSGGNKSSQDPFPRPNNGGNDGFHSQPGNPQNAGSKTANPVTYRTPNAGIQSVNPGPSVLDGINGGDTSYGPIGGDPASTDPWNSPDAQSDPYGWGGVPGSNDPGYLGGYPGAEDPGNAYSPYSSSYGGDTSPMSGWGDYSQPDSSGFQDPGASAGNGFDSSWDSSGSSVGGWDTSALGGFDNSGSGGFDNSSSWDDSSGNGDSSFSDTSDYARGGPVGGGAVPSSMSPSGGRRTDDIQATIPQTGGKAMINAGEFVLPRDVVAWKGQEFFQKMIQQARKARTGAPAKPSTKPSGGFNAR